MEKIGILLSLIFVVALGGSCSKDVSVLGPNNPNNDGQDEFDPDDDDFEELQRQGLNGETHCVPENCSSVSMGSMSSNTAAYFTYKALSACHEDNETLRIGIRLLCNEPLRVESGGGFDFRVPDISCGRDEEPYEESLLLNVRISQDDRHVLPNIGESVTLPYKISRDNYAPRMVEIPFGNLILEESEISLCD